MRVGFIARRDRRIVAALQQVELRVHLFHASFRVRPDRILHHHHIARLRHREIRLRRHDHRKRLKRRRAVNFRLRAFELQFAQIRRAPLRRHRPQHVRQKLRPVLSIAGESLSNFADTLMTPFLPSTFASPFANGISTVPLKSIGVEPLAWL